jgi:MFS transporter, DHA3 family, macrolide efflux protein
MDEVEVAPARTVNGRWRRTAYARLFDRRDFRLLWLGQIVSNLGTYTYTLAVAALLTDRVSGRSLAHDVAVVLSVQALSAAAVGLLLAGPIADRFDRRRIMVVSDVVRCAAVVTLLPGSPSVMHLALVAMVLGGVGALFEPSLAASLPNVVEEEEIVPANAVVGGTFYGAVMVGPALGAFVVALGGVRAAFFVNAISFLGSGILIAATSLRQTRGPTDDRITPVVLARDLADGARHLAHSRLAVAIMFVMCAVVAAAGAQATLQVVFVKQVLAPGSADHAARAAALAILTTAWGGGMLLGSFVSPVLIRHLPRERLIPVVVAVAGACVIAGSQARSVWWVAGLWIVAGVMCGVTNVSYESLVQERTPDGYRGRMIATIEAAQEGAYFLGVAAAGWLLVTSPAIGLRSVGVVFTLIGVAAAFVLPKGDVGSTAAVGRTETPDRSTRLPARPRAFVPGLGTWPEWLSLSTPWDVTREGDVVTIELRWPLVPSDWDRLIVQLSAVLDDNVVAIVMPSRLPRGSVLPHSALEELWRAIMQQGISVHRIERRVLAAARSS